MPASFRPVCGLGLTGCGLGFGVKTLGLGVKTFGLRIHENGSGHIWEYYFNHGASNGKEHGE